MGFNRIIYLTGFLLVMAGVQYPGVARAAEWRDFFADRQGVSSEAGQLAGTNQAASVEVDEPRHGGKNGGHSLWISWTSPADGIVTFGTAGSDFDTLLGVYTLSSGTGSDLQRLKKVVLNDDFGTNKTSQVEMGVTAGTTYEVAVDGYEGAVGTVVLHWSLLPSSKPPPILLNVPTDRSFQLGDTVTLTVDYQARSSVKTVWFFNDVELPNTEEPTLVIPNFQEQNVGQYKLRFTHDGIRFFTTPIELQINTEGLTNVLARDKLFDAEASGLKREDDEEPAAASASRLHAMVSAAAVGVVRGYNGSQIFNTTYATSDPAEPLHCNVAGGASYWFSYQPPTNGLAQLSTEGSSFDTVLAVYSYKPPLTGYAQLVPVDCDNNSGSNGLTSKVAFTADSTRSYFVVVAGIKGARGIAHLNYSLTATPSPSQFPPAITRQPAARTGRVGDSITFVVESAGTPPLHYQWSRDSIPLTNTDTATLTLAPVQLAQAGLYSVQVRNASGFTSSSNAMLTVLGPSIVHFDAVSGRVQLRFPMAGQAPFTIEFTESMNPPLWKPWSGSFISQEGGGFLEAAPGGLPKTGYFRMRFP